MSFFTPIDKMWERVEVARDDSNTSVFYELLFLGEMLTKIVASGLIAAIDDDRDRHRYQQMYRLMRADGIGEWAQVIDDVLTGPPAQNFIPPASLENRELTQALSSGTWQYDAVFLLNNCLKTIDPSCENIQTKVAARRWFSTFARLRNKTRGHGAIKSSSINAIVSEFEQSIRLLIDNFNLFKRPWVYLYPNLSGKYRVTRLTPTASNLDTLKKRDAIGVKFNEGVHISFDEPEKFKFLRYVEIIRSDVDASDFFFPNGAFTDKKYELISYITDTRNQGDSTPYLTPPLDLPQDFRLSFK